jgi:hypothetical protein
MRLNGDALVKRRQLRCPCTRFVLHVTNYRDGGWRDAGALDMFEYRDEQLGKSRQLFVHGDRDVIVRSERKP